MPVEGFVNENSYYIPLKENFEDSTQNNSSSVSIDLLDPNNVFELQNSVSDKLNTYETKYSRYIKCQDSSTSQNLKPRCTNDDTFTNVTISYNDLLKSIDKLNSSYVKQKKVKENNSEENYQKTMETISKQYAEMINLRKRLDKQLSDLQYNLKNNKESPKKRLDSTILGYILWVILASCLIYYIFYH